MGKHLKTETKVGIFVLLGTFLTMSAIILLGGNTGLFTKQHRYFSYFNSAQQVIEGAKVVLNGIRVGVVRKIEFDSQKEMVRISYDVGASHAELLKTSAFAEIATQGVLGDKYISLNGGKLSDNTLLPNSEIKSNPGQQLSSFISEGGNLVKTLNSIAGNLDQLLIAFRKDNKDESFFNGLSQTVNNLAKTTNELNDSGLKESIQTLHSILNKIDQGEGSLGALINDRGLYDNTMALIGGANRNRVMRNLVRKTIKDAEYRDRKINSDTPKKK